MYDRFSYLVKGIALRYSKNNVQAEDIVQESFIKVFNKLHTYKSQGDLGGWIRIITVNTALAFLRKKKLIMYGDETIVDHHQERITYLDDLELEDLLSKIRALPAGFQTVFNLYAVEGYTHKEIGEKLGISEGTSKSQYSRAKVELRKMIDEELKREEKIKNIRHVGS
ncbi:MAG: RNA polymerase sigma factor [Brumimicrobium sp.]